MISPFERLEELKKELEELTKLAQNERIVGSSHLEITADKIILLRGKIEAIEEILVWFGSQAKELEEWCYRGNIEQTNDTMMLLEKVKELFGVLLKK